MNEETKIQTLSLVAGTEACNARCPFCVSKMTPLQGVTLKEEPIDWDRFKVAMTLAKEGNTETAMITGKGEPTLFPGHITGYLDNLRSEENAQGFQIPKKELQTNAIVFDRKRAQYDPLLERWAELELETVAISIVHYEPERNREIYLPYSNSYINLESVLEYLHGMGIRTRLACVLVNGYIDSSDKIARLIDFARNNNSEELTIRPVNKPDLAQGDVYEWTAAHHLTRPQFEDIHTFLEKNGSIQREFPFGATVYDMGGQNVCLTNSLTKDTNSHYKRQLIFFPNGRIATDWTEGSQAL